MIEPLLLLDIAVRIVTAIVLGAAIGLERQWRLRTAGIRTNALVSVGSALFVILGAVGLGETAGADPTRVAAQVVSGIGFLGAGVILRDGINVRGVTTAATLWSAAAIGSLAGAGMEEVAVLGSAAVIATNILLRPLSRIISRRVNENESAPPDTDDDDDILEEDATDFMLEVVTNEKSETRVRALVLQALTRPDYLLRSLDIRRGHSGKVSLIAAVSVQSSDDTDGLEFAMQRIALEPKVTSSRWWLAEQDV